MLHRQQQVAGGDAGTAHHHDFLRTAAREQRLDFRTQLLRGLEVPRAQVFGDGTIDRARNVARDRIDRLGFAAEALACARIQQPTGCFIQPRQHLFRADDARWVEACGIGGFDGNFRR